MNSPIRLAYPDKGLSPNARLNRYALNDLKQAARQEGFYAAKEASLSLTIGALQMFICIHPPDRRRRDDDNVLASLKAARDGIFDALGINDSHVRLSSHGFGRPVKNGAVLIWIEPLKEIPDWLQYE